jgi:hypothetical protein
MRDPLEAEMPVGCLRGRGNNRHRVGGRISLTRGPCSRQRHDARQSQFEKPYPPKGVAAEFLRREMTACNHEVFLTAQERLAKLRVEAFELVQPITKRLVKSLADELNDHGLDWRATAGQGRATGPRWSYLAPSR